MDFSVMFHLSIRFVSYDFLKFPRRLKNKYRWISRWHTVGVKSCKMNVDDSQGRINARAPRGWNPGAYTGKGAHWLQGNYIFWIIIYMGVCSSDNSIQWTNSHTHVWKNERMDETHLSVFHSVLSHARGKRSRNGLFRTLSVPVVSVLFQLVFFFFFF